MKLPIIEKMQTAQTGKIIPLLPRMTFERSVKSMDGPFSRHPDAFEVRSTSTFTVYQTAEDPKALPTLHNQAVHMAMHEIYGPVQERLHEILHMLYEDGPVYDSRIAKAVCALIDDLRP